MSISEFVRNNAVDSTADAAFTRAVLVFRDGSQLRFEHSSRQNRQARASISESMADTVGRALEQFRLNGRHLELFFKDGSSFELKPGERERSQSDGGSLGKT